MSHGMESLNQQENRIKMKDQSSTPNTFKSKFQKKQTTDSMKVKYYKRNIDGRLRMFCIISAT